VSGICVNEHDAYLCLPTKTLRLRMKAVNFREIFALRQYAALISGIQ
jgi:hypothetical protein